MAAVANVVDVGAELPGIQRRMLKAGSIRRTSNGTWKSHWRQARVTQRLIESRVRKEVQRSRPDVVVQIQDLCSLDAPFMVLQDLNYEMLIERFSASGVPHFRTLTRAQIDSLRARQQEIYDSAAMLLPMSKWMAASLIRQGVPASRIRVVNPGVNAELPDDYVMPERRTEPVRKLLLVGRDFDTKGGEQLVAAFGLLRSDLGPHITLTIAGPKTWPTSAVPEGVKFLGPVSQQRVAQLMDEHDLFVMPSQFEGFGIAFAEALIRGLPCIGRDDCAMPEIIDLASGGRLVKTESPEELAALINDSLNDDELYSNCAAAATGRRKHYTWSRAASQIVDASRSVVGKTPSPPARSGI